MNPIYPTRSRHMLVNHFVRYLSFRVFLKGPKVATESEHIYKRPCYMWDRDYLPSCTSSGRILQTVFGSSIRGVALTRHPIIKFYYVGSMISFEIFRTRIMFFHARPHVLYFKLCKVSSILVYSFRSCAYEKYERTDRHCIIVSCVS